MPLYLSPDDVTEEIVMPAGPPVSPAAECGCAESQALRRKLADVMVWAGAVGRTLKRIGEGEMPLATAFGLRDGAEATVLDIQQILGLAPATKETK